MLHCPFCGVEEADRIDLEGRRFVVFPCMFTPEVDPTLSEEEVQARLGETHRGGGTPYFRGMCDRLHLYVTAGEGGRRLTERSGPGAPPGSEAVSGSADGSATDPRPDRESTPGH